VSATLVVAAALLAALSGAPPLLSRRGSARADTRAAALSIAASLVGLAGVGLSVAGRGGAPLRLAWALPGGAFHVAVDGLSALFLVPLFVVSSLGAVYARAYWPPALRPRTAPRMRFFYGVATGAIAVVLVATNAILFLFVWELMALASFFLVLTEGHRRDARAAAWLYIAATHTSVLALFALFALLARLSGGSFELASLPAGLAAGPAGTAVFWLAVFGFGLKAGLLPFHIWLPSAHAAAPSHVSALMSGVLIKTGVYGLVRVLSLFPDPPLRWGGILMAFGAVSGVLGVAFALGQHDLKRLLAYHSIENIGIIVLGVGLGFAGVALHRPAWAVLGLGGGLLHVVNHALFKALLFLGAGSVIHATGTREMDRMGGLLRHLPRTAGTFLVGSVAICGLPPLNGFVSEWLLYLGLLGPASERGPLATGAAGAAAALALIGGLALACFVKAFGAVFLGVPRKAAPERAHEAAGMVAPMLILAALCAVIGLVPTAAAPLVDGAVRAVFTVGGGAPAGRVDGSLAAVAPLAVLGLVQIAVAAAVTLAAGVLAWRLHGLGVVRGIPTWDCGYAAPTPRMQYTASSFAAWSVGHFRWALHPETTLPGLDRPFPREARFGSHVPDTVLDRLILPVMHGSARLVAASRVLQRGRMQLYLVYVAVALVLLLWRV